MIRQTRKILPGDLVFSGGIFTGEECCIVLQFEYCTSTYFAANGIICYLKEQRIYIGRYEPLYEREILLKIT